jgi:predicted P-loop ATPase
MTKITKIKTRLGELGAPVSVELDTIVERMQSDMTKAAADRIARVALASRLAMAEGMPRYVIRDTDRLPYLIFSATFGKDGIQKPITATGLVLLTIPCPEGLQQIRKLQARVRQIDYTLLAFAGVSGSTLKVVVRCDYKASDNSLPDADDYTSWLKDAHESAARLYTVLTQCNLLVGEQHIARGCRMSYDPQLYYNPKALIMPVVRQDDDPLQPYEGAKADDDGQVVWYPDHSDMERAELEFQACLSKAIENSDNDALLCLNNLADYCHKAGLAEEGCTVRAQWTPRLKGLGEDLIRKTFRNTYKKPYNGKHVSQMNEKERIMRSIEEFLSRRYQLRFNTVKQITEFRPNDLRFKPWQPLMDRQLKSIVVEEMKEGGESWMNDIRTYIESAHIEDYNPIHEFLAACTPWDHKHNYIEDFARRLPTDFVDWPHYFHRWFLAMVAQALNINRDYGNSMVPMLIGDQGFKKSSFCKAILPPSMREYYMDDIKMDNAEQVERVLGRMWLVCIDEYNAKTDREQAKIKRLLTEKDVQMRKMRSDQYTLRPRLCSFIANTNDRTPLPSGDGSRRYLCVEVTAQVDMSGRIPYKQMFAQAVEELSKTDCIYWFTSEDEQAIQQHNQKYQDKAPLEQVLGSVFEPVKQHRKEYFWQVQDIQKELAKHLNASDMPSLRALGITLKKLRWERGGIDGMTGYYLKLKS